MALSNGKTVATSHARISGAFGKIGAAQTVTLSTSAAADSSALTAGAMYRFTCNADCYFKIKNSTAATVGGANCILLLAGQELILTPTARTDTGTALVISAIAVTSAGSLNIARLDEVADY